ncbi:Pentatricopeptide repeat-containing protein [Nymphaea thermarum]|nr:Pentatricopeptide repeat-containing protein [Nymphaea thermarum]
MSSLTNKPKLMGTTHLSSPLASFKTQPLQKPSTLGIQRAPQVPSSTQRATFEETRQIHAHIIRTQFHHHPYPFLLGKSLYAQYNFIITSYTKNNSPEDAINVYLHMRSTGMPLDEFIIPSILKACAESQAGDQGMEVHGFVTKVGLGWDAFVQNSLMQMYSECRMVDSMRKVFDKMPERDVVSWGTLIGGYNSNRCFVEAADIIKEMHDAGVKPSEVTMINMINLFAGFGDPKIAKSMHGFVIKNQNSELYLSTNTALIDMYAKCGSLCPARRLFDELPERSIVSWTAMIAGYIHSSSLEEGLKLFQDMQDENVHPNEVTMLSMTTECGNAAVLDFGKWLHAYMIKTGFNMSFVLVTALLDMYAKCGDIYSARFLFDRMSYKDVMCWTAMISGYARAGDLNRAYNLFVQMQNAKIKPNQVTLASMLSLCANTGALDIGKWVHACIDKHGLKDDIILTTALLDMYSKCGDLDKAEQVFAGAPDRDICMWNAMMSAFAMHGQGKNALKLFHQMEHAGVRPNDITFIALLHACSHAGLLADGHQVFKRMIHEFALRPKVEHYGCMVDLLGRAGLLDKAYNLIERMPCRPNVVIWGTLLAACKIHGNTHLGELAAKSLIELEPDNCGYHVLLSNMYAAANRWGDVAEVRKKLKDQGIKKEPGFSSIEVNNSVHQFVMGDHSHPQAKKIQEMLSEMNKKLKSAGYIANTSVVLLNIDEEEKEIALANHSEKLAIAFGLISTTSDTPIRIVKNLRVCDDCHSATKLISKIYGRVIVVRDRNRFHHFKDGSCSCGDFW